MGKLGVPAMKMALKAVLTVFGGLIVWPSMKRPGRVFYKKDDDACSASEKRRRSVAPREGARAGGPDCRHRHCLSAEQSAEPGLSRAPGGAPPGGLLRLQGAARVVSRSSSLPGASGAQGRPRPPRGARPRSRAVTAPDAQRPSISMKAEPPRCDGEGDDCGGLRRGRAKLVAPATGGRSRDPRPGARRGLGHSAHGGAPGAPYELLLLLLLHLLGDRRITFEASEK